MRKIFQMLFGGGGNGNKGTAILLAVCVLCIVSALSLFFTSSTITSRKEAKNQHDLTVARILINSTLNRILSGMNIYAADITKDYTDVVCKNDDPTYTDTQKKEDLDTLLPTDISGIQYYSRSNYLSSTDTPEWQYIPLSHGIGGEAILGRISFVVINNKGKINPSACVDSGYNAYINDMEKKGQPIYAITEYPSTADLSSAVNSYPYTSVDVNGSERLGRCGVYVNEVWLKAISFLTDTMLKKMSAVNANPAGAMPTGGTWADPEQLFAALSIKNSAVKKQFLDIFDFNNLLDPEAFWIDVNANGMSSFSEFYHRFNLARNDWNQLTVDDFINSSPVLSTSPATDSDIRTIPWLKNWKQQGTFSSVDACKKQVIANLIDYCKSSYEATTDSADSPTYTGNNKTPYINEIGAYFPLTIDCTSSQTAFNISLDSSEMGCELINMYGLNDGTQPVTSFDILSGSYIRFTYFSTDSNNKPISGTYTYYLSLKNLITSSINSSYSSMNWQTLCFDGQESKATGYISRKKNTKVEVSDLKLYLRAKLYYNYAGTGEKFADFSNVYKNDSADTVSQSGGGTTTNYFYFAFEADDPRQNLNIADWNSAAALRTDQSNRQDYGTTSVKIGTPGTKNSSVTCYNTSDTSYDIDTATEPYLISTAYIRKGPMKSPWELGVIHRGAKWQTINLKRYNSDVDNGVGSTAGGDAYTKGDANILDQIKMTSDLETLGKFNVNSQIPSVLKTLFYAIYVGSGYENPGNVFLNIDDKKAGTISTWVNDSTAQTLENNTIAATSSLTGEFHTRAQVLREPNGVSSLWNNTLGLSQNNDAKREEIIGKFINLTKAEPINSGIVVIIVCQTIKDVGGIVGTSIGTYDVSKDIVTATQKAIVIISRNPITNKFWISKFEYADE